MPALKALKPQNLHPALRPLPSAVKGLQACRLPAFRPLPSVGKGVQHAVCQPSNQAFLLDNTILQRKFAGTARGPTLQPMLSNVQRRSLSLLIFCVPFCPERANSCSLRSMNSYPKRFLGYLPVSPVHTSNRPQRSKKVQSSIAQNANGTQQDMRHVYKRMVVKCGIFEVYRQVCVCVQIYLFICLFI